MQFSIWPEVSHGVDYRGQIALFFSSFFSFSFGLLLFARRHEQVPLRCDLHCTTTTAAARLPAVCLLLRNEWKNVWVGFSECALVSLHISRHKRWKSFLPLSRKSQPLWSRYKKKPGRDISAGESDCCCHEEQNLITAWPSVCPLGRRERNRVTGKKISHVSAFWRTHACTRHSESQ